MNEFCDTCERELALCDWDGEDRNCDSCRAKNERREWVHRTCAEVERLAAEHGWDHDGWQRAQTGSCYLELSRECGNCILGKEDGCECETLTVRVSDHGTAYCREDVSLAMSAGGDDHTLAALIERLEK